RGLADTVRTDHADDAVAWQRKRQVADELPVAEALLNTVRLDHEIAQPGTRWDLDLFEVELAALLRLGGHLLVPLEPGPLLGLPALGVRAHPLELVLQPLLPLRVLGAFDLESGRLGLQVSRVVALVWVRTSA